MRNWGLTLGCLTALGLLTGCFDEGTAATSDGTGGTGPLPAGGGVGDVCAPSQPCRSGLTCNASGVCEPGGTLTEGQKCIIGGECQSGLQCAGGVCVQAGTSEQGESCSSDVDCVSGLKCAIVGFSTQCVPEGNGDVGATCTTATDCFAGLACTAGQCGLPVPGVPPFGASLWPGVDCPSNPSGPVRAYFEIPGVDDPAGLTGDFFRLPFPNDVRSLGGKLDLSGFPTPGADLLGFDPVKRYVDALVANETAWGTYSTVTFRFSGAIDFESFKFKPGEPSPMNWVDVTAGTPEYSSSPGLFWSASGGRTKYICDNWMAVRRSPGAPMTPGHTYAVWMTTAARAEGGAMMERSPQLAALLAGSAPSHPKLAAAHAAYAPFRAYLADKNIDPSTILNATVITAGEVRRPVETLASTIDKLGTPTVASWTKCGGGAQSPCPQADGERACGAGGADYDEYHALVTLPVFQKGTAPYLDSGGDLDLFTPVRSEAVCLALTVPKSAAPAAGYPLVVYAHGTGGSFRSHVRDEVAGLLSKATTPGATVGFAVLGIDQVQHGPRRGASSESPNNLFFNFANPAAARGNPIQGAADQLSLVRLAASLTVPGAVTGGADVGFDPAGLVFYGHSQGATHGSLALPYAEGVGGAVLSGNGASLIHALLGKTEPVNIAGAVPFVLADFNATGELAGGDLHPVLSLLQHHIEPADPVNYALAIGREPVPGKSARHLLQTYGLGDRFSPPVTLQHFALAARLALAAPDASVTAPDAIGGLSPQPVPLSGNFTGASGALTLGVRQYAPPAGRDGHFVALDVATARSDLARFLGMVALGEVPDIGP
ncbi:MAG: hypothetical protein KF718_23400 [Polyangiaceae bacterium]|nr:hypothetical protein [Polyangiaceae bacterium]